MYKLRAATNNDYNFLYYLLETSMKEYYIEAFGSWDEKLEKDLKVYHLNYEKQKQEIFNKQQNELEGKGTDMLYKEEKKSITPSF